MKDDLWRRTTFEKRRPMVEDNLWRKTTFDKRQRSIGCIVYYLKKMFTTPHLGSHSTTVPELEFLSAIQTGNRISLDWRNARGIMQVHVCKKDNIFRQRRLNHSGIGEEFMVKMPCQSYHIQRPYVAMVFKLTLTEINLWVQNFFHCMLPSPLCGIF